MGGMPTDGNATVLHGSLLENVWVRGVRLPAAEDQLRSRHMRPGPAPPGAGPVAPTLEEARAPARSLLKPAADGGDAAGVEAEPVHPAEVARVLHFQAAVHDDGDA